MNPILKQVLFSVLFLLFLSLSFLGLYLIFYSTTITFLSSLIFFLIILCFSNTFFVFLALSFLQITTYKTKEIKGGFLAFLVVFLGSFSIFFWFGFNIYSFLAFILFLVLLFSSYHLIKREQSKYLKFDFSRVFKISKWTFLTGFAVLIAFVAFLSPKLLGGKIQLPRSLYDAAFPKIEQQLISQYPGFSGEMTVDEFILLVSFKNPPKNFPIKKTEIKTYSDFKNVSEKFEKKINKKELDKLLKENRKELLNSFGVDQAEIKIKGNEKVSDVLYKISSNWLEAKSKIYQYVAGIIAGLILFLFLMARLVLSIAGFFYLPIAWFFFKFLRKINFFKIDIEKVEKEKITI